MKLITRDTDYGIRAICYMAGKKGAVVSVSELVAGLKIPRPFLRKILQVLSRRRIVVSYKGMGGGFVLATEPGRIYIVNVMEIFQGPLRLNECTFKKILCPNRKKCPLKKKVDRIESYMLAELGAITIKDLI